MRERFAHARFELRCQVDFGDEQQDLAFVGDRQSRGGEKDVGLAAARHALQQKRREDACRAANRISGRELVLVLRYLDGRLTRRRFLYIRA